MCGGSNSIGWIVICLPQRLAHWNADGIVGRERDYRISRTIRRPMIFSLEVLEKNTDECILILVIYWKKIGLLNTKISNHNIIYSS